MLDPRLTLTSAVLAVVLALATVTSAPARSSTRVQLTVSPTRARTGNYLYVKATNLPSKQFFTFVFDPAQMPSLRRLFGPVRSDSHGRLSTRYVVPAIRFCGHATVDLFRGSKQLARAPITIVGCKSSHAPPPPPKPSH